ncbi:MAG TPA: hypothetical protein VFZ34_19765 [Blastocatellia bacterium]|nr:hypothetical protein [Blastocatellia bacterium]
MKRTQLLKAHASILHLGVAAMTMLSIFVATNAQEARGRMVTPKPRAEASQQTVEAAAIPLDQAAAATLAQIIPSLGNFNSYEKTRVLRFDVSENAKRFIFDETPLHPDGAPAYGNEFVTEGYIYPEGTLNGTNGVNPDGSPEFPHKVIGRWTCRGWHVGEGAKTVTGPWVVTHQYFDFGHKPGRVSLATDGVELVDIDVPVMRAIIGGTGIYAQARGEAKQTMIGFNQLNGVNLRLEIKVNLR